jgi:predicted nucleic acid-binding Zn ribbon protein
VRIKPGLNFLKISTYMSPGKKCISCGEPVRGRSDKKFCNDYCRNAYNNQLKKSNSHVRVINTALGKNRRILEGLLPEGEETCRANKENLHRLGFQFTYITHTYTTKAGKTYFYCYDYGYLPLGNDWFLVVKKKETTAHIIG